MTHHHPHESEYREGSEGKPSMRDKLVKMVEFWVHHNQEHAHSYYDWAGRARMMGLKEVGDILEKLSGEALLPNRSLEEVLALLKAQSAPH
jgi:hypothetical protein